MREVMLTTVDNPHDPFTNFAAWYSFDVAAGYRSSELLATYAKLSPHLSQAEENRIIEEAIDEIVSLNVSGMHRKVEKEI